MVKHFKTIIFCIASVVLIILFVFVITHIPRKIEKSYDAIMYLKEAYMAKDYENLDMKKTTLHIKGKLYLRWFKRPIFIGYIDTDAVPIDKTITRKEPIYIDHPYETYLIYYPMGSSGLYSYHYATGYFTKDLDRFYIEFEEASGYKGYCLVAPAQDIEDINDIIKDRYND